MTLYWRNKVALITGGTAGLGLDLARALSRGGARVVLVGRDAAKIEASVNALRREFKNDPALEALRRETELLDGDSQGIEQRFVVGLSADVTKQDQVDSTLARAVDRFGKLDLLVNCAGKSARGEAAATTPQQFQELWETNFLGVVRCTRAALPHLIKSQGHLVNIGSLASKAASRYLGAYPASKFAVAAYSQQLRLELAEKNVHVLLVCPGPIRRDDSGERYTAAAHELPAAARQPGAGVKLKGLDPARLAAQILRACERRQVELVAPAKARLLFALAQLWPGLGDWLLRKFTAG